MKVQVKKRLLFLTIAVLIYTAEFTWLPADWLYEGTIISLLPLIFAIVGYLIIVPVMHCCWVIVARNYMNWTNYFAALSSPAPDSSHSINQK